MSNAEREFFYYVNTLSKRFCRGERAATERAEATFICRMGF